MKPIKGQRAMEKAYDLTFVIPIYNSENSIINLINNISSIELNNFQLLLVDDASTDGSKKEIRRMQREFNNITLIELKENRGAGNARNVGFNESLSKYTMFFDSDDKIHGEEISENINIMNADENVDVAMFSYIYDDLTPSSFKGMSYLDQSILDKALKNEKRKKLSIWTCPDLARFSNYPWNKIIRTKTYKENNLRFSTTKVNNDILAHWKILSLARKITLNRGAVCTHIVDSNSSNITNKSDERRLEMFRALQELYGFLESDPKIRRLLCVQYWDLVLSLSKWYENKIQPSLKHEYNFLLRSLIMKINLEDILIIKKSGNDILARRLVDKVA